MTLSGRSSKGENRTLVFKACIYVTHAISYSVLMSIKVYLILFVLHFSTKTAMSIIGSKTDRYLLDD